MAHRRVGRDPGAEQRRGPGEVEVGGNAQNEAFIDDDAVGVAAVGDAAQVLVGRVVGEGGIWAELLQAGLALGAGVVRIDQAADRGEVARLVLGNGRADLGDAPDDLVAGDDRVDRGHDAAPLVADRMEIGVADAAEEDFDLHVVFGRLATLDLSVSQRRCRTGSRVSFRVVHGFMLLLFSVSVLFVADLFHPVDGFAVELLLNGDVRHRRRGRRPMPMLFARRKPDHVARPNFLDRPTPSLRPAAAGRHDQGLTERVRMPCRPGSRLEGDAGANSPRRLGACQTADRSEPCR